MTDLTKIEIKVLKECCEEPRTLEGMFEAVGLTKEELKKVLDKLKSKGLVYCDDIRIWCSTVEGDKLYYKK